MRAAKELLIRGFGSAIPGVSRILSGKTEELDSYLSKIVREYTDHGADSVRFLIKAMENKTPDATSKGAQNPYPKFESQRKTKPAEGFTASQRVWAACELLRRAYDIRTDHITPAEIQAYRKSQTPAADADHHAAASERPAAAENIAAAEKPNHANRPADNSDGAPATETRAARRRQKRADRKAEKRAISEQPAAATANIAAAEKPAITAEQRDDDKHPNAEKPATANSDGAPAAETRASRRRQKRNARKAQKRAANTRNDTPARSVYPEDIANIEAYKERLQAKSDAIRDAKLRNVDIRKIPELKRHITPEEVAAFQRQPGSLYNRTREMYKEKYGEYPFPDDIPPNARSP